MRDDNFIYLELLEKRIELFKSLPASLLSARRDDLLVKPFDTAELLARERIVLRRRRHPGPDVFRLEDLQVNRASHEVSRAGRALEPSPKEYAHLEFLLRHPGRPVTRNSIIEEVWRMQTDSMTNAVDVYIKYLRGTIDAGFDRPLIHTIHGDGYQIGGNHFSH